MQQPSSGMTGQYPYMDVSLLGSDVPPTKTKCLRTAEVVFSAFRSEAIKLFHQFLSLTTRSIL